MDGLTVFIPLLPLLAGIIVGMGNFCRVFSGENKETLTADISLWAMTLSCLMSLVLLAADLLGKNTGTFNAGEWLRCDTLIVSVNFISTGFNVRIAALFAVLLTIIMRFSVNYMHRETGYFRFFFVFNVFASAMLLLVLSGSAVMTFIGWELAGLCSYLLIAYHYDRPIAVTNATRVFVTNRVGDAGFVLGIGLNVVWTGSVNWLDINNASIALEVGDATAISFCFALAAFAKSAQLPFTPWLARAMEGPTPSSAAFYGAVMIHAGIFLVIFLHTLFEQAPLVMSLLVAVGLLTAIYSFLVGLTQTDVKSSLVFATSGQLGLMFVECGLGFWQLASWHLAAHAIVRGYQVLTAPSLLHNVLDNPIRPVSPFLAKSRWLYVASVQRFWLDQMIDWGLVKPVQQLAHDLSYFDEHELDRFMAVSAPVMRAAATLAQLEEKSIGAHLDNDVDDFAHGSGLAGKLTQWTAALMHWLEDHLVLRGISQGADKKNRQLGYIVNQIERTVLRPRYLVLFVFITLLVTF
ncbi:NADH-quinone oxidoreductase subunit L [Crenothrix polyspora]|uniref:NADH-quinone oxidoreductase subunit L n=1 Tax=Crenothrix polyspora TaxID=360316 RepID=A0A1R4H632_9GAMM|nr:proton-conducting transporter membrane subunit [Crenothrix polyspora]SJM91702.1 NADH-quinone oxidoreductase subunit L [Crenothrix polyspora]